MWRVLARLLLRTDCIRVWLVRRLHPRWSDVTAALLVAVLYFPAVFMFDVHPLVAVGWSLGMVFFVGAHTVVRQMENDIKLYVQIDTHVTKAMEALMKEEKT